MTAVSALSGIVNNSCRVTKIQRGKGKNANRLELKNEKGHWLAIDFDKPGAPLNDLESRPDFLFVSDNGGAMPNIGQTDPGRLVPIEMSMGQSKSLKKLSFQLQAAANWADSSMNRKLNPTLFPIYTGKLDHYVSNQIKSNKNYRISFRGQRISIKLINSGQEIPKSKSAGK